MTSAHGHDAVGGAAILDDAARRSPDDADLWYALGLARFDLREHDAADEAFTRVIALRPGTVGARVVLGTIRYLDGRPDDGYALHSDALAIETTNPRHLTARALLRVARGDWTRGWLEYEARWSPKVGFRFAGPHGAAHLAQRWGGEPLPHGTVCVHAEAGLGDTILFARYLPLVAARAARVVIAGAPPELARLLDTVPGLAGHASADELASPDVRHVGAFSLPFALGSTEETVPRDVPYLAPPARGPRLAERGAATGLRAGIAWAGRPSQHLDRDRSVPDLALLADVFRVPGVEWISLQLGPRGAEASSSGILPTPPVGDLADTAHVLTQLDLVLTIDSSVANLAGALGVPTWVLAQTHPEIRWPVHRGDSPWFPTARVFRRAHSGEWTGVAGRVAAALAQRVAGAAREGGA